MRIEIDATSSTPPYEQLRSQVAAQVADGRLPAGTRLPTVRQLATDLGVAANTVARAYRELESDGVVATRGRNGTIVSSDVLEPGGRHHDLATAYVAAARRAGLTLPEATRLVEQTWSR
jgi:DNA-binding transcriptional regulator YhcF (GntR family)